MYLYIMLYCYIICNYNSVQLLNLMPRSVGEANFGPGPTSLGTLLLNTIGLHTLQST